MIRTLLTALAVVFALPVLLAAQDASERPEGIICLEPACDIRTSLPRSVSGPPQAEPFLVERVRHISTSVLDARLPEMPFELWLFSTLQLHLARAHAPFADWSLTFCDEPKSAVPRAGPDLCIHVKVPVVGERLVNVHIGVATGSTSTAGDTGWKETVPAVRDIYVDRLNPERLLEQHAVDSLDVPALDQLESRMQLPFGEWPTVDLRSAASWQRETPQPDNLIRFRISVANRGTRDADRAAVDVVLTIPQIDGERKEIRRAWFPRVAAGKSTSFDIFVRLPRGDATVIVSAAAKEGFKRIREVNPEDNVAVMQIPPPR